MLKVILSSLTVVAILFAVQACAPKKPTSEEACGFNQNVYGERISWNKNVPVGFYIHESVPTEFYPAIERAMKDWETATGIKFFIILDYSYKSALDPKRDGINVIYWMNTWEADHSSEQARTSVYWEGDEIKETDIRINAKDFTFYVDTPNSPKDLHLESLLVHELGHVLGLKHQDQSASVMASTLDSNVVRTNISTGDVNSIRCEY